MFVADAIILGNRRDIIIVSFFSIAGIAYHLTVFQCWLSAECIRVDVIVAIFSRTQPCTATLASSAAALPGFELHGFGKFTAHQAAFSLFLTAFTISAISTTCRLARTLSM